MVKLNSKINFDDYMECMNLIRSYENGQAGINQAEAAKRLGVDRERVSKWYKNLFPKGKLPILVTKPNSTTQTSTTERQNAEKSMPKEPRAGGSREHAIKSDPVKVLPVLHTVVLDLFCVRPHTKLESPDQLEMQQEIVLRMLLRCAQHPKALEQLAVILFESRRVDTDRWRKLSDMIAEKLVWGLETEEVVWERVYMGWVQDWREQDAAAAAMRRQKQAEKDTMAQVARLRRQVREAERELQNGSVNEEILSPS